MLSPEHRPRFSVRTNNIDVSGTARYVDALGKVEEARFHRDMQKSAKIIDTMTLCPDHKEALQTFYAFCQFRLTNEEIARALNISVDQVKSHIRLVENELVDQWNAFEKEGTKKRGKKSRS